MPTRVDNQDVVTGGVTRGSSEHKLACECVRLCVSVYVLTCERARVRAGVRVSALCACVRACQGRGQSNVPKTERFGSQMGRG